MGFLNLTMVLSREARCAVSEAHPYPRSSSCAASLGPAGWCRAPLAERFKPTPPLDWLGAMSAPVREGEREELLRTLFTEFADFTACVDPAALSPVLRRLPASVKSALCVRRAAAQIFRGLSKHHAHAAAVLADSKGGQKPVKAAPKD